MSATNSSFLFDMGQVGGLSGGFKSSSKKFDMTFVPMVWQPLHARKTWMFGTMLILACFVTEPSSQTETDDEVLERQMLEQMMALGYSPSDDDLSFISKLRPGQMRDILARLTALAQLEAGKTTKEASEIASVSLPTMFRLKRAWKDEKNRSLTSIAGFSGRKKRGTDTSERFNHARFLAKLMLQSGPGPRSVNDFAELIYLQSDQSISLKAAERIARDALSDKMLLSENLARRYGRDIVVDAVAVSLVIEDTFDAGTLSKELALLALVLDRASGLVLAAEVTRECDAVRSQYAALASANWFVRDKRAEAQWLEPARIHVTVGPAADPYAPNFAARLKTLLGERQVKSDGPRRFGRAAKEILGSSLGPLMLLPGSTESGKVATAHARAIGREPVTVRKAKDIVSTIVDEHNEPLLERLLHLGAITSPYMSSRSGPIGRALEILLRDPDLHPRTPN